MRRKTMAAMLVSLCLVAWGNNRKTAAWELTQLTACPQGRVSFPWINAAGDQVFFISTCDLNGKNRDQNPEVFKWESGGITQLTATDFCQTEDLAFSPQTGKLAFSSNCGFGGKNESRGTELIVLEPSGEIQVLTEGRGYISKSPAWSRDGQALVFISYADLLGQNPDHSPEIFHLSFESETPELLQLSRTRNPYGCNQPAFFTGGVIGRCDEDFPSTTPPRTKDQPLFPAVISASPAGANSDHNHELFSFTISGQVNQLTYTKACEIGAFAVNPSGRFIAFASDCNLIPKTNPDPGRRPNLFLLSATVMAPFPDLTLSVLSLAWSGNGERLALSSPLTGGFQNPEANPEIFIATLFPDRPQQPLSDLSPLTDFHAGTSDQPVLNQDGTVLVFVSTANPLLRNNDGSAELFMAREPQKEESTE